MFVIFFSDFSEIRCFQVILKSQFGSQTFRDKDLYSLIVSSPYRKKTFDDLLTYVIYFVSKSL